MSKECIHFFGPLCILLYVYARCSDVVYTRDIDNSGAVFRILKAAPELSMSLVKSMSAHLV